MASQLTGETTRRRVLAGAPLTERRLDLAGVSTAVLEGGDGPSVVLLHGQGGWAGMWLPVAADLVRTHRVIAPDLPGLGASIAARFAIAHPDRLSRLVLVDAGSLARFRPAPGVLVALVRFVARPTERTQQGFLRQVAVDPARARANAG
jgi:pimeloyl-ACP methyl ester carboxylesterase